MATIDIQRILDDTRSEEKQVPKTKIVCTLGPASRSVEMIEKLLKAGMNVGRFNFSHGSHEYHQETLDNLKIAMQNTGILCAVMLDTKGPEIRTGFLKDSKPIKLTKGQEITVTTDYSIKGDENTISMSYKKLPVDVKPGNVILCSDGTISLTVMSCDPEAGTVRCMCENNATLGERKNVNLPGIVVDLPTLTEKDKEDILGWGVPNDIDMIALSFVRKGSDLVNVRRVLGPHHAKRIKLMSKVENQEGVINFDDILRQTDAFMVARGDLGMEIPVEKIFLAQKMMIYKCNLVGKPVVTATQMLESMIKSPRPTRAEATDVANAVLDGTDCVMLSGESAAGAYPELAVRTMARICIEAESSLDYDAIFKEMIRSAPLPMSPLESLASSAVRTANKAKASLIVVLTRGGTTARLVAKYRPRVPIMSVVVPLLSTDSFDWTISDETPARHSLIYRGLIPVLSEGSAKATDSESTEVILDAALKAAVKKQLCKPGDAVVAMHRIGVSARVLSCYTVNEIIWAKSLATPLSMIMSPQPTRAEATDVANAVLDGTDCVMLSGESATGAYLELAVRIMARICIEAESSLDYDAIFKEMRRYVFDTWCFSLSAPLPMSPLESLASSAVCTANKAKASLIVVLTRGGTTARLVAKYRPRVPIMSVVVPLLSTDSFDWTISDETPARHSLIYRGLIPVLSEGSAKATDSESTEVILDAALKAAVKKQLCKPGDAVVAMHRIGIASVIKICMVK